MAYAGHEPDSNAPVRLDKSYTRGLYNSQQMLDVTTQALAGDGFLEGGLR
jgi:hypothetical protein